MPANTDTLSWTTVDTASLPADSLALYTSYKTAQKAASEQREAFDTAFKSLLRSNTGDTLAGKGVLVTHKFGKLSFAITDTPEAGKKGAAKVFSFAPVAAAAVIPTNGKGKGKGATPITA